MTFLVSIGIIGVVFFICDSLRLRLRSSTYSPIIKVAVGDFLVTTEQFVATLEQGVTFDRYGRLGFALGLFTICAYQMLRYKENLPTPIVHFYSLFISKTQKWWETLLRVLSLVAYGFLVQRVFMRSFWALNLSEYHSKRIEFYNYCFFPDHWNPYLAFCMEFTGSLILCIVPSLINESKGLSIYPFYKTVMKSVLAVSLVLIGFDISGGMYNPVVATVLVGRCKGHSYTEHIIVYWFGATSGSLFGSILYPRIRKTILGDSVLKKNV